MIASVYALGQLGSIESVACNHDLFSSLMLPLHNNKLSMLASTILKNK